VAKVADIMTADPVCCTQDDTVERAAQIMKDESVGPVPVVRDEESRELVGIVTDRDLAIRVIADGLNPMTTTVGMVMSRVLVTCQESDDVRTALDLMAEHQLRRIPVVGPGLRVTGIVAQGDVATRIDEPEAVAEVVEEISEQKR
jgi:CBS domain-containing protein